MRVLVVEDEASLADGIAECLRREAYAVDVAYDGLAALERIGARSYDVVVLDRDLPRVHGDEVHRGIVASGGRSRVLMLTATSPDAAGRLPGTLIGADDYLAKPFAPVEVTTKVRALARRGFPSPPVLFRRGVQLDPERRRAVRDGREIALSARETAVLAELLRAGGRTVATRHLLSSVWGDDAAPSGNVVRVTVMRLRRKLGDPPLIRTVSGTGYRIP
ncbi:response regulator transcription factor [Thermostaphylospora chromogena]|uniref:response regulator transcription factor n=1 Tax=Thermostaphylospora chromogena TaxID=35622 RepID=UPI000B832C54|nr:response regulator transcription factor [Thermostaphylospora chromogena]